MNNKLGWTSIEQSKKLIEAGLPIETADMHYINDKHPGCVPYQEWLQGTEITPCWSLGALIELMPKENKLPFLDSNPFIGFGDGVYRCVYLNGDWESSHQTIGNTAIDACVNMILFLLENNYIKKGETTSISKTIEQ